MYVFQILFLLVGPFASEVLCGLQPYYLNLPPPAYPVTNGIESDFSYSTFPQNNSSSTTRGSNLPSGPIPLVLHTWVRSADNADVTKLQNGTLVYYVGGPWGGIRSADPASPSAAPLNDINSIPGSAGSGYPTSSPGWSSDQKQANVYITTPPPLPGRQQGTGPWGHGHFGFGWPSSTQLYDKLPETTTVATRNQVIPNLATTTTTENISGSTGTATVSNAGETTTTVDPVAANTNNRFPVSDSVLKFRRIVAQIRAITRKELATERTTTRRSTRRLTT